jgi:hypothetical protein
MVHARLLPVLIVAMSIGCAAASTSGATGDRRSQLITQQEISASGMSGSAFEIITRLRPNFLVSRGQTTINNGQSVASYPNVYLDGVTFGDINTLRNIDSAQIAEIRLYQAWEAQTKFGLGNNGGVIAITTRR